MWLYLPKTASTSSLSAPGAAGLTLDLNSQSQRLAAALWWRGKPSPSRTWLQRLNRVSWLQQAIWDDVRTFDGRPWRGLVDGLIGGIPCQPHSLAGKKQGQLDERDLWSDARRIVVQSGCWWVLIENVGGMLAAGADEVAGAERVRGDLLKLGFSVEIGLFTAAETGASHERLRVFILAVADARRPEWRQGNASGHDQHRGASGRYQGAGRAAKPSQDVADARGAGSQGGELGGSPAERHGAIASRPAAELRGAPVANATGGRRGKRSAGGPPRAASGGFSGAGEELAISDIGRQQRDFGRPGAQEPAPQRRGRAMADTDHGAPEVGQSDAIVIGGRPVEPTGDWPAGGRLGVYPPGPSDLDGWRRVLAHSPDLEPSVRRMADGLAARLDLSGPHAARVDRLRLLGNGVVSLAAAHAVRTLVTRLAATGSAGAAELARLMVQA